MRFAGIIALRQDNFTDEELQTLKQVKSNEALVGGLRCSLNKTSWRTQMSALNRATVFRFISEHIALSIINEHVWQTWIDSG